MDQGVTEALGRTCHSRYSPLISRLHERQGGAERWPRGWVSSSGLGSGIRSSKRRSPRSVASMGSPCKRFSQYSAAAVASVWDDANEPAPPVMFLGCDILHPTIKIARKTGHG